MPLTLLVDPLTYLHLLNIRGTAISDSRRVQKSNEEKARDKRGVQSSTCVHSALDELRGDKPLMNSIML